MVAASYGNTVTYTARRSFPDNIHIFPLILEICFVIVLILLKRGWHRIVAFH